MRRKKQEVVVITGASGGIGRAAVREFARRGARLALLARGEEGLRAAAREAEDLGARAIAIPTDVADPEQVERAAQRAENELGPIDIWINVAFTNVFSEFWDVTPEEWRRLTDVTYLGYVWGTMSAIKRMRPRNRGTIVQVGSALCYRSIPLQSPYCGAKSAIRGFTDSLRCELIHHKSKIKLTIVQMPAVNTPQFTWNRVKSGLNHPQPLPPIFQPEIAGRAIYWAAHKTPREMWVAFSTVLAIMVQKFAPRIGDLYLAMTGYKSQQTAEPIRPGRPDNLYAAADQERRFRRARRVRGQSLGAQPRNRPHHLPAAGFGRDRAGRRGCGRAAFAPQELARSLPQPLERFAILPQQLAHVRFP